ncbi:chemotaxis response regulator protein-glutamate methylesterase [Clostridium acetireducens DSM 10703]|jgi:two-component system chemotaxis response regulator CheB|uniref:Protein-glutamate methylesterase/protein-glutamine glutaminase n=1 Tax=Clostridium acetireducens DSM 10703 TaxID=1121290 RepID=A0A1E8EZC8_9CLOT|nr:chemotaxis response regulator protein-glutamate methylesterase [Clostridium acetireducens]OFI06520.1 chemotaxis response regulator protein-glutamate methylesterase [Clostridium acetireducens DSM 10703]
MHKIKVLVVDDSALMRKIISDMINSQEDMEVITTAKNGEDFLNKLNKYKPNVITLDVEMPKMDGITALKELKKKYIQIPVIVLSSVSSKGPKMTMECLANGAFDFLAKPSGAISLDINKVQEDLVSKIRLASLKDKNNLQEIKKSTIKEKDLTKEKDLKREIKSSNYKKTIEAVVIGASTGGPKALYKVITSLPKKFNVPVFVVQHMPAGFTKAFAERLDANSPIKVVEAKSGDLIVKDVVYIAPGGYHMEVGKDKRIHLNEDPPVWGVRPAVDKLFISASEVYGSNLLSVVLTGMGKDGADGTVKVKQAGGITLSEDESTCTIYGMPKAAFETGKVDRVFPINEIAEEIIKAVQLSRR